MHNCMYLSSYDAMSLTRYIQLATTLILEHLQSALNH